MDSRHDLRSCPKTQTTPIQFITASSHYANIINGSFEEIGIGLKEGTINGRTVTFVTEDFGTPNSSERAEANDVETTATAPAPVTSSPSPTPTPTPSTAGLTLNGNDWGNTLKGGAGNDTLNGHGGKDMLTGGAGSDRFVFDTAREANGDTITDFIHGTDKIDLTHIDANTRAAGDQGFTFIGEQGFHKAAGELKAYQSGGNTYLAGDINGNGSADFTIRALGILDVANGDFIL